AEKLNRFRDAQARGEAPKPEVKIEFDGITRRAHQVTHLSDNITTVAVSPDSKLYAFVAGADQDGRASATPYTIPEDRTHTATVATSTRGPGDEEGGGGPGGARLINSVKFSKDGHSIFLWRVKACTRWNWSLRPGEARAGEGERPHLRPSGAIRSAGASTSPRASRWTIARSGSRCSTKAGA